MLLAAAIGLPLGVLLTRQQRWARPVIGFANVMQTMPSLALFGLLLPVPWLGERAARMAIRGADRVCAAADFSQYLCGDWECRSGGD